MKKILPICTLLVLTFAITGNTGCTKGEDGTPGKSGNANVTARTFSVSSWASNSSRWYAQLSVPELNSSNINSASVQVYWGTVSNNWLALPYTYVTSTTNYFMGYLTTVNLVEVRWDYNGAGIGSDPNTVFGSAVQIKVVVIPPAAMVANPHLDLKNYQEVAKQFNL